MRGPRPWEGHRGRGRVSGLGGRRVWPRGGLGRGPVRGLRGRKRSADLPDPLLPGFTHGSQARSSVSANAITQVNV